MFDDDVAEIGYVMNVSRLWAYQPDTVSGLFSLLRQANSVDSLTLRQRCILVSACASAFGDSYCSLVWATKLAEASDAQTAAGVLRGADHGLTTSERAMADWARKVARNPNATTAEDVQTLRDAGFGRPAGGSPGPAGWWSTSPRIVPSAASFCFRGRCRPRSRATSRSRSRRRRGRPRSGLWWAMPICWRWRFTFKAAPS